MSYRKYDPQVKEMIIASKDPNLFPHLNIPRTTALYWIAQGKKESSTTGLSQEGQQLRNRLNEYEVFKLKAINLLLKDLLKSTNPYADFKSSADPNVKSRVVDLVESMNGFIPKTSLIHDLGLSPSTYYRWRSERLGCDFEKIKCHSGRPAQLTIDEQKIIVSLARDPRLKQLSTKSLMYYAQRNGIIDCSLDSWYKYMKIYKIDRKVNKGGKRKRYLEGVRANKVNDIWHIDITQFYTKNRKKLYVQFIVDNYSRAIINWKVSDRKNTQITLKSLLGSDLDTHRPEYLVSDGGGENCNNEVKKVLTGKGITQLIAKADVKFSNSMVEAVFRQLKQKYIEGTIKSKRDLELRISEFVRKYNCANPHSSLGGGTPSEVHNGAWDTNEFKSLIRDRREKRIALRSRDYQRCKVCVGKC